jgi:hypothetical protein
MSDPMRFVRFDAEPVAVPHATSLTIIGQDPSVAGPGGILKARVSIPTEPGGRVTPGPRGSRFHVVDYDATSRCLVAPGPWGTDVIGGASDEAIRNDPAVRAQNVYAIAARTLALFESALGRRLPWSFEGHQLYLAPAAFAEANAFYDPDTGAVLFGYFTAGADEGREGGSTVYTSLSHDVVAHETTHAILDGLRARFEEPSLPDQAALHEALADIVALLSVCSLPELVLNLLRPAEQKGPLISDEDLSEARLAQNPLFGLAEEVGAATRAHGGALRRAVLLAPRTDLMGDPGYQEAHSRGDILVAAVTQAFLAIWQRRLSDLHLRGQPLNAKRAADEGAKAATHLLTMCIRAIDYLPPLDVSFADFLAALRAADSEVVPDDDLGYRKAITATFEAFGIVAADPETRPSVGRHHAFSYALLHAGELERRDEMFRFIWANADRLGIPIDQYLEVEAVQPSVRVGPDGFVVRELVATYVQLVNGSGDELGALAAGLGGHLEVPSSIVRGTKIQLQGGGTLIFDDYGRVKYHVVKPLYDWDRQGARLAYLVGHGIRGKNGGVGSSYGLGKGQRFSALHGEEPGSDTW